MGDRGISDCYFEAIQQAQLCPALFDVVQRTNPDAGIRMPGLPGGTEQSRKTAIVHNICRGAFADACRGVRELSAGQGAGGRERRLVRSTQCVQQPTEFIYPPGYPLPWVFDHIEAPTHLVTYSLPLLQALSPCPITG